MSELRDRLEALANRGTRRGVDDVLSAAQRDAQSAVGDDMDELDNSDMTIIDDDDDLPVVTMEPKRRRRFGSFVASAGIAALVGVGILAVSAMFGSGGADSPEGAVRQLADAVSHKDPLAAVDVLVPSEVRTLRNSVDSVSHRAADLQIVSDASKPLEGIDLSVDNLTLRTEPLGDGYTKVIVTGGEISGATHRNQFSPLLQKAMRDNQDVHGTANLAALAGEDSDLETFVVAVKQGGGWYVSPAYTAFEYAREANDDPPADFGSAKTANLGADTPEAAVTDAFHAAQAGDWNRLFALAPPDELPLYDYRAMLAKETADGGKPDFTIDALNTKASVDGDTATVTVEASGKSGSDPEQTWQIGGTCPTDSSLYDGESGITCLSGNTALPLSVFSLAGVGGNSLASNGEISVSLVKEDGRWFISPVTTILKGLDSSIQQVDQRMVYSLLGLAYLLPPDGTITLDQPFELQRPDQILSSTVYAFEGQAGQEVVGEAKGTGKQSDWSYQYGSIYTADGEQVGSIDFQVIPSASCAPTSQSTSCDSYSYVSSTKLPATGSYRLVLDPYWAPDNDGVTLTLWDLKNAPKNVKDAAAHTNDPIYGDDFGSGVSICESTGGILGSESCTAQFPQSTPTTLGLGSSVEGHFSQSSSGLAGNGSQSVTETTSLAPTTTIGK